MKGRFKFSSGCCCGDGGEPEDNRTCNLPEAECLWSGAVGSIDDLDFTITFKNDFPIYYFPPVKSNNDESQDQ